MPLSLRDYADRDATALAELVASGEVSPSELVDLAQQAVGAVNGELNAVVHDMFDQARAAAADPPAGPFRGVPMAVKDFDGFVAGEPWTAGTRWAAPAASSRHSSSSRGRRR